MRSLRYIAPMLLALLWPASPHASAQGSSEESLPRHASDILLMSRHLAELSGAARACNDDHALHQAERLFDALVRSSINQGYLKQENLAQIQELGKEAHRNAYEAWPREGVTCDDVARAIAHRQTLIQMLGQSR